MRNIPKELVEKYNNIEGKYKTAYHRGGLKECLETEEKITNETAKKLIKNKIYEFYAYDQRIDADRFILTKMEDLGLPTWLHHYK